LRTLQAFLLCKSYSLVPMVRKPFLRVFFAVGGLIPLRIHLFLVQLADKMAVHIEPSSKVLHGKTASLSTNRLNSPAPIIYPPPFRIKSAEHRERLPGMQR
jgi:hypothetical protein